MYSELRDAWREVFNNIAVEIDFDFICKINSFVSRNESLEWGVLRSGSVGVSGTDYIPPIPDKKSVTQKINEILNIKNVTLRAIKYMLYGMRSQLFWDGNKRTSMIIANVILIQNGRGIITVKEDNILEFNQLLTEFYNTNDDEKIIDFIYDKCIFGIDK